MRGKYVAPSVNETSFSCPHCGTLAPQNWINLHGKSFEGKPPIWDAEKIVEWKARDKDKHPADFWDYFERAGTQVPFADKLSEGVYTYYGLVNHFVSVCAQCDEIAVWIADRMLWPQTMSVTEPNEDLPEDIARDYREAGAILAISPRGAAALLRLCVQKLCRQLLGPDATKTIDQDIASLVSRGLDKKVEQALDIVRVVGNEAVHPGTMDLRDDTATAEELFALINIIADEMISRPRRIDELYAKLPPEKVKGIEDRNARALPKPEKS